MDPSLAAIIDRAIRLLSLLRMSEAKDYGMVGESKMARGVRPGRLWRSMLRPYE